MLAAIAAMHVGFYRDCAAIVGACPSHWGGHTLQLLVDVPTAESSTHQKRMKRLKPPFLVVY